MNVPYGLHRAPVADAVFFDTEFPVPDVLNALLMRDSDNC